ncbi:MAG: hypothetical protein JNJ59_00780 [Deltaproteobacteria bacterium]|nr:hypothetical protein [Deltaproteobacteria bacterium]
MRQTEDEAFISTLKDGFGIAAQDIRGAMPARSDAELLLVCAAFDARVATRSAYSAAKVQGLPMGARKQ